MDYRFFAIIVAGGSGKRMNSTTPKQFLLINNKPIIVHTIEKFLQSAYSPEIVLVLSEKDQHYWNELSKTSSLNTNYHFASGGAERFFSVKNGLEKVNDLLKPREKAIIAIHDAVRPLVSTETIDKCFTAAKDKGNGISYAPSKDSVRIIDPHTSSNRSVPRQQIALIQTPQSFDYDLLKKAYLQEYNENFTDDASVVEAAGYSINLVEGDVFNIKITYPEDIILAKTLLEES